MANLVAIFHGNIIITIYIGPYGPNPNITLNCPEATPVEQVRYMVNKASLLPSVMVDQPIIQVTLSSSETFNGNKSKLRHG